MGSEPGQPPEFTYPLLDLFACHPGGAQQRKALAAKRGHDAPVNHRAPKVMLDGAFGRREVTHHPADERIAGACRVFDHLERIRRRDEHALTRHRYRAVLALLHEHDLGPERQDVPGGLEQVFRPALGWGVTPPGKSSHGRRHRLVGLFLAGLPAAADHLVFQVPPNRVTAGAILLPFVQVAVEDRFGNVVSSDTSTVSVALVREASRLNARASMHQGRKRG